MTIRADSLEELVTLKASANAQQKRVGSNYRFVLSFNSALILLGALGILPPATSAMLHNLSTFGISLRSGECIACEACVGTCPKQNICRWDLALCKHRWLPVLGKALLFFQLGCWLGFCRII